MGSLYFKTCLYTNTNVKSAGSLLKLLYAGMKSPSAQNAVQKASKNKFRSLLLRPTKTIAQSLRAHAGAIAPGNTSTGRGAAADIAARRRMFFLGKRFLLIAFCMGAFAQGCSSDGSAQREKIHANADAPAQGATSQGAKSKSEIVSERIKSAKASAHTFSQRRLLGVVEEQEAFFSWLESERDKNSPEARTRARKLNGLWNEYLADNPNDVDALILYGKFRRATGSLAEAYKIFKRADSLDGNIPVVKQQLATFEGESGSYKDAYSHLKLAVQLDPKQAVYHSQMGQLLILFRDKFISSGMFDRQTIDKMYLESLRNAYQLAPEREDYKWRYAQSFFDVSEADWNEPLRVWNELLPTATLELERQTINANRARVLIELYRDAEAEEILKSINHPSLAQAKQAMLDVIRKDSETARGSESKILKQMQSGAPEGAKLRSVVEDSPAANSAASQQSCPHFERKEYSH